MTVVSAHFEVSESVVRYQALGKLLELSYEISGERKLNSDRTLAKIKKASQIRAWLKALDYGNYLTREQRDKIKYALVHIAGITQFPTSPVLGNVARPAILINGSGGGNTIINNFNAGVPYENLDVDTGTEDVFTIPTSSANGVVIHYVVRKGAAYRSGEVIAVWDGTNADLTETSTPDLGGSTTDLVLGCDINAGNFRFRATAASNDWSVAGKYYLIDE